MKKLIVSMMLGVALLSIFGCGTTANNRAVKTEQVLIPSVNIAMEQWAEVVKKGRANQSQVDMVKTVYQNYYNSQILFKAAIEKSITQASSAPTEVEVNLAAQAVEDAKAALLTLLSQLTKK